ncbi:MAG: hypothetical protein ACT6RF_09090 [Allorhizobium sp.]|uniref:hypothetical protein n=1 Tax=Allorhizobium sp. TaxID=633478 RepID=UPI004033440D
MAEPQDAAAKAASTSWDDIRLWIALGLSIISLFWNEVNRRKANSLTRQVRQETIKLEEFRTTVKTPVREALQACEAVGTKVEAISRSARTLAELGDEIQAANLQAIDALSILETRLSDANDSSFARGSDWLDGFDQEQDHVLSCFNAASNTVNSDAVRRAALLRVKTTLSQLRSSVKTKIEAEITAIANQK